MKKKKKKAKEGKEEKKEKEGKKKKEEEGKDLFSFFARKSGNYEPERKNEEGQKKKKKQRGQDLKSAEAGRKRKNAMGSGQSILAFGPPGHGKSEEEATPKHTAKKGKLGD